ncbi:MAG: PspC domain-containing protein [Microbacteriaceae bacterium]
MSQTTYTRSPSLTRPILGRMLGGVCAGIAQRFGWSVATVRVLALLSVFLPGPQVLIYLGLWLLVPAEGRA